MSATPVTPADRLGFTFFLALAIHAVLIFGTGFALQSSEPAKAQSLEVTLTFHPSDKAPKEADFMAQSNQQGSGTLDKKREQTTDQRSAFHNPTLQDVNLVPPSSRSASPSSRLYLTSITQTTQQVAATPSKQPTPANKLPKRDQEHLKPLSRKIATLEARLARQKQAYAKRPMPRFISSVSAVASYEALYINAFRQEVEAVGTRNFPKKALRDHIFGNVRLRVDIKPNGHIRQIKLLHSSGYDLLDNAAMRSVRLAAPFAPFTDEMLKHYKHNNYDYLAIIRTWKFDATSTLTSSYGS